MWTRRRGQQGISVKPQEPKGCHKDHASKPWVQADVHTYCNLRLKMPSFAPCHFMLGFWGACQERRNVRQDGS